MQRRDFMKVIIAGAGSAAFSDAFAADDKCIVPWSSATKPFAWKKKEGPYKIALSNSYIGNAWRKEMVQIAKAYTQQPDVKPHIKQFMVSSSGNDVNAQIAQISQMILSGVDAIVIDAATPTGLNSVIDQAVDNGILVVSFDCLVTTRKALVVNEDNYEIGKKLADFVVEKTGGKGNVLMVRGVAGTFIDQELTRAAKAVFSKHPEIKTTEVYGNWDNGTAQKVTANALAAGTQFAAVWSQVGSIGVVRAFQQAGAKIPPIAGEAQNGFHKLAAKLKFPMLSIEQSPALSAMSIKVAIAVLQGKQVPRKISVPLPIATNDTLKAGVNYFPDLPDSLFTPINIAPCGLKFDVKKILAQKV